MTDSHATVFLRRYPSILLFSSVKPYVMWTGEMTQYLRLLTTLAQNQSLVPSTHTVPQNISNSGFRKSDHNITIARHFVSLYLDKRWEEHYRVGIVWNKTIYGIFYIPVSELVMIALAGFGTTASISVRALPMSSWGQRPDWIWAAPPHGLGSRNKRHLTSTE